MEDGQDFQTETEVLQAFQLWECCTAASRTSTPHCCQKTHALFCCFAGKMHERSTNVVVWLYLDFQFHASGTGNQRQTVAPHWGAGVGDYSLGCYFFQTKAIWHGDMPSECLLAQAHHGLQCKNNLHWWGGWYVQASENLSIDVASGMWYSMWSTRQRDQKYSTGFLSIFPC